MIKSSIKLFILYRIWLIDWLIDWLIYWLDNDLRHIDNISAIKLQFKGFKHVAEEIYISINIQKLYLIFYKSKTKNKFPLFRSVSLYSMIKSIAAFFFQKCAWVIVLWSTVQFRILPCNIDRVLLLKIIKSDLNYKQIPTGYIKEVYSIVLQFIECNPFHYTSNHY